MSPSDVIHVKHKTVSMLAATLEQFSCISQTVFLSLWATRWHDNKDWCSLLHSVITPAGKTGDKWSLKRETTTCNRLPSGHLIHPCPSALFSRRLTAPHKCTFLFSNTVLFILGVDVEWRWMGGGGGNLQRVIEVGGGGGVWVNTVSLATVW